MYYAEGARREQGWRKWRKSHWHQAFGMGQTSCSWADADFQGVSTGACIGHISPEALAGGPIGKIRDGISFESKLIASIFKARLILLG